jgi:hypothetical protein
MPFRQMEEPEALGDRTHDLMSSFIIRPSKETSIIRVPEPRTEHLMFCRKRGKILPVKLRGS